MAWNLVGFIPLVLTLGGLYGWLHFRHLWKGELPVTEKLLQGPGESLRVKMDELSEQLMTPAMVVAFAGLTLGYLTSKCASAVEPFRTEVLSVIWCIAIGTMFFAVWRLVYVLRKYKDFQLGFIGERAVGEELNKLMFDGCYVFHDVPAKGRGNIDHVVIAPSGVYAIETKAPRKKKRQGSEYYKVYFDGSALLFPDKARDSRCVEQAERNANWLADTLSKGEGDVPVQVHPILILAGWWVERKAKGSVTVLNHNEIQKNNIMKGPRLLPELQMKRMAKQVEDRCRTIIF
jgi:hypothetical protein